jgi:hypothetical protein
MKTFKQLLSDEAAKTITEADTATNEEIQQTIDELSDTLLDRAAQAAAIKQKAAKNAPRRSVHDIAKRTVQKAKFQQKTTRPDMSHVA